MRRFIASLPGKILSHAVVVSLIMPAISLFVVCSRAEAQFAAKDTIAVNDFVITAPRSTPGMGREMAEAFNNELSKSDQYDSTPPETVARVADSLGLQMPVVGMTNLLRLGSELQVKYLAVGEILNYRIVEDGGLKHADIIVRVRVMDVSSGIDVKGAAAIGHSTDRAGDVSDATLISGAIADASASLARDVLAQKLTKGTILNTVGDSALVNQGTRVGFAEGQRVIVRRGREQVATASIYDVEPDQCNAKILTSTKGIQPGDTVEILYSVPNISSKWPRNPNAEAPVAGPRTSRPSNTGFVQLLLLAGLLGVLFGSGHSSNTDVFTSVQAQAGMFLGNAPASDPSSGLPGVMVNWGTDFSLRGNSERFQFQVYRENPAEQFAISCPGTQSNAIDNAAGQTTNQITDLTIGGSTCVNTTVTETEVIVPPLSLGQPYQYAVELVYKISSLDLPNPGSTVTDCYFLTQKSFGPGVATPINQPQPVFPTDPYPITGPITFSFNSSQVLLPLTMDYAIEVSTANTFPAGQTVVVAKTTSNTSGILSMPNQVDFNSLALPAYIRQASTLYWRLGARNSTDRPGPVPDAIGQRYVFSSWRRLTRPVVP